MQWKASCVPVILSPQLMLSSLATMLEGYRIHQLGLWDQPLQGRREAIKTLCG